MVYIRFPHKYIFGWQFYEQNIVRTIKHWTLGFQSLYLKEHGIFDENVLNKVPYVCNDSFFN